MISHRVSVRVARLRSTHLTPPIYEAHHAYAPHGLCTRSASDNTLWLTYTDGSSLYYRTSSDNGVTWSDGVQWTLGDNEGNVECTDLPGGPLCVFLAFGRADDAALAELFIGQLGVSVDPRLSVGTEGVGAGVPHSFTLSQNYPNPFNPGTTITFDLQRPQQVNLTLHDLLGRRIRVLASGVRSAGPNDVTVDGSGLTSGVYFYRLQTEDGTASRVMTVLK